MSNIQVSACSFDDVGAVWRMWVAQEHARGAQTSQRNFLVHLERLLSWEQKGSQVNVGARADDQNGL